MCTGCRDELNSSSATCLERLSLVHNLLVALETLFLSDERKRKRKNPGHARGEVRCMKEVDDVQETLPPLCLPVGMME